MALKKSEKRLLIIAGLVAAAFLFDKFVLSNKGGKSKPAPKSKIVATQSAQSNQVVSATHPGTSQRVMFDDWGKDPFRVIEEKKVETVSSQSVVARAPKPVIPDATLHGIFWKEGKAYVLINDDIMSEGEMKNGIRIDRIEDERVLCNYAGQSFTLYWRETL